MGLTERILDVKSSELTIRYIHDEEAGIAKPRLASNVIAYSTFVFPSIDAAENITRGEFPVKSVCCVCGEPSERTAIGWPNSTYSRFWRWYGGIERIRLPVCELHFEGRAKCVLIPEYWNTRRAMLRCTSLSFEFVLEFRKRLREGRFYPPWIAFPGSLPGIGWNQGTNEAWIIEWRRFWWSLTDAGRNDYLTEWPPPAEWYDHFRNGWEEKLR